MVSPTALGQAKPTSSHPGKRLSSAEIDALWDFDDPAKSNARFVEALISNSANADEIHTQIARALGLQDRFAEAHAEIAKVSRHPGDLVLVRVELEAGRIENSSGNKAAAEPHFLKAFGLATKRKLDFYAIDAAHMMGIVTSGQISLEWNERAIGMAEKTRDKRAQGWKGSLLNNTGWTYHDMGRFEKALDLFNRALTYFETQGKEPGIRIAKWTVGRCLRSLKRYDEALAIMRKLEGGAEDGSISEELGELTLATGHPAESKPYFRRAYEKLSADPWEKANEAPRLEHLKKLGD